MSPRHHSKIKGRQSGRFHALQDAKASRPKGVHAAEVSRRLGGRETEVEGSGTVSRKGSEAWERREKKSEPRLSQNGVVVGSSKYVIDTSASLSLLHLSASWSMLARLTS